MLSSMLPSLLLAGSIVDVALAGVAHGRRDGSDPSLTYDPNTTPYCTWWVDLTSAKSCSTLLSENAIDLVSFRRWNPSITDTCVLQTGHSYCVEAFFEPPVSTARPTTTSTSKTSASTTAPTTTTKTSTGNGVSTPTPTQAQIVNNCNKFYFVKSGESCSSVASANGITLAQFTAWNPSVGSTCAGLWANAYACVGIIGGATATRPPTTTTTTTKGNGIATPTPTQPNMVGNCDSFYRVVSGDTCASIASKSRISQSQFVQWNPSVGSSCSGLWLDVYVCISVIGHTPTPTNPGNGVATPTPIQDGMTKSCKTFHFVVSGNTCATIAQQYRITTAQFISWNPAVGSSCTSLWTNTYACVAVL